MRNLKRVLSLTLASVMLLGMMVVGTSAAGFPDVDEDDNVEAIEVLQAIEVMVGDDRGFGPDRPVTRNEMAVVMGKLLNLNYNYYTSTCPFTDVAPWARGWVGACSANGIVSGRGEGIYDGEATVTAVEAASMMMRALGYFQYTEDYKDGFQLSTVKQGSDIGIFNGVGTNATTAMTRNQVAQMALNALRSEMVTFTGNPGIDVNGVKVSYRAEYTPRTGTEAKYNSIAGLTTTLGKDESRYYIQLGEQLYDGDLRLRDSSDDFARPARTWEYEGKEIGTYMKKELIRDEYTTAVNGKTLYELLGKAVIEDNDVDYFWNGREDETIAPSNMIRTNTKDYTTTGNGVLTQVFFDTANDQITITTIDTFLADVDDDYNEKKGELSSITIHTDRTDAKGVGFGVDTKVGVDEAPIVEKYKDGDRIKVQVAWSGSRYEIATVSDPEVVTDVTLTKYSKEKYVVGGTQYDYALDGKASNGAKDAVSEYATDALTDYTYDLYLDQYGYLLGNVQHGGKTEYVFITGYNFNTSNLANSRATANGIFLDGTMKNIQVNVTETQKKIQAYNTAAGATKDGYQDFNLPTATTGHQSEYNSWFTYTTEEVDGVTVYTLKPVEGWMDVVVTASNEKINSASVRLDADVGPTGGRAYGNDDSVYITVGTDDVSGNTNVGISKVNGVYTGVQDVDMRVLENTHDDYNLAGTSKKLHVDPVAGQPGSRVQVDEAAGNVKQSSIFAVYDTGDKYIIGAIVIGEDDGSNRDYIYVLDDIKNESVVVDSKDVQWEVDVAKGGQVETMTIKTTKSKFEDIKDAFDEAANIVNPGNPETATAVNGMLKLVYDKDGYVIDVEKVGDANTTDAVYGNSDVSAQEKIDRNTEKAYLVQYDASGKGEWTNAAGTTVTPASAAALGAVDFTADGRTLYAESASHTTDKGVTIVSSAPVVVIQPWIDSNGDIEYKYETFTGDKAIKNALKSMANEGADFQGWVAAVLNERGTAEYLILSSEVPNSVDTVDPDVGGSGSGIGGREVTEDNTATDTTGFGSMIPGAYIFENADQIRPGDINGENTDNMFFLTHTTGAKSFTATLEIKDSAGKVVYREYTSGSDAAYEDAIKTPYFYVQVIGAGINNAGQLDLKDTPLKVGTYTWTIKGTGITEVSGEFEITK